MHVSMEEKQIEKEQRNFHNINSATTLTILLLVLICFLVCFAFCAVLVDLTLINWGKQ